MTEKSAEKSAETSAEKSAGTSAGQNRPSQQAVWYFIGATFIFVLPNTLFDDLSGWPRFAFIALGILVLIAGFVQLRREFKEHSRTRSTQAS